MLGVPFARQEKYWYQLGLMLTRSNMANWSIRCTEEWLMPIYNRIHNVLMNCHSLHMDETRIQCNKEEGRKAHSQSFMWVIRSGAHESIAASFFHYSKTRSSEVAQNLLNGFHSYLTTDAYVAYGKVDGVKNNFCWSHLRSYG